jgi:hypothetical protein
LDLLGTVLLHKSIYLLFKAIKPIKKDLGVSANFHSRHVIPCYFFSGSVEKDVKPSNLR